MRSVIQAKILTVTCLLLLFITGALGAQNEKHSTTKGISLNQDDSIYQGCVETDPNNQCLLCYRRKVHGKGCGHPIPASDACEIYGNINNSCAQCREGYYLKHTSTKPYVTGCFPIPNKIDHCFIASAFSNRVGCLACKAPYYVTRGFKSCATVKKPVQHCALGASGSGGLGTCQLCQDGYAQDHFAKYNDDTHCKPSTIPGCAVYGVASKKCQACNPYGGWSIVPGGTCKKF